MNTTTTHLAFALLVCLLSSCSAEGDRDGNILPEGKYPLTFTASVDATVETRATSDNTWSAGDQIAVRAEVDGEQVVKTYICNADGLFTVASGDPFYWESTKEKKRIDAWYCGDGSTAPGEDYEKVLPTEWEVQTDQSRNGFQKSDFLHTGPLDILFSSVSNTIQFQHKVARVVINIMKTEYLQTAEDIASVILGRNDNISLRHTYYPSSNIGGTGTTTGGNLPKGTIIPKDITSSPADDNILKTYTAFLPLQALRNTELFGLELKNGEVYYYKDDVLLPGDIYIYNVSIKAGRIDVVVLDEAGGTWEPGEGAIEDITSSK